LTDVSCLIDTTAVQAGALTVAGQRRIHTVFPSILAIQLLVMAVGNATTSMSSNNLR
jgi:hypothetical protein